MCNIRLDKLSPNLYQEAVKAAKENKVDAQLDKLVNLAAKGGFTAEEKKFLIGLASNVNLDKLKKGDVPSLEIDFAEPGISFENNPTETTTPATTNSTETPAVVTTEAEPKAEDSTKTSTFAQIGKMFDENIMAPIKNVKQGVSENIQQVLIEKKIKTSETLVQSLGTTTFDNLESKIKDPNDKAAFLNLHKTLDTDGQNALKALLASNIPLTQKDTQGKSLINNINEIASIRVNRSTGDFINGKTLAKEAISILQNDKNITQGAHGTCGAGSLQNLMRDTYPSELVRIVKDLAKDGKAVLADKNDVSALKVARNSINYKENGRNQFNRIFQSAVMQRVALVGGDERGSSIKDAAKSWGFINSKVPREIEYDIENDDGGPKAVASGDSAADPILLTQLMNRMLKGKSQFKTDSSYDLSDLLGADKLKAIKPGTIACYKTEGMFGGRHYIMVTGIKKNEQDGKTYVNFKNTADVNETSMDIKEFSKRLEFTISKK